jgi:hypothetical protein
MKSLTYILQLVVARVIQPGVDPIFLRDGVIKNDSYFMLLGSMRVQLLYATSRV